MRKIQVAILVGMLFTLFSASNAFAVYYRCIVTAVTPKPNGIVEIKFVPGTDEGRFVDQARATLNPDDPGAKNMLATVLTAISLNKEITISLEAPPSNDLQDINGIGLKLD